LQISDVVPLLRRNVLRPIIADGGVVDIFGHTWEKSDCTDCTQRASALEDALRDAIPSAEARRVRIQSSTDHIVAPLNFGSRAYAGQLTKIK
jgi:hypothetical protein